MKNKVSTTAILVATLAVLGACSATGKQPSYGEALQANGGDSVELGKTWEAGNELETKGAKEIAKGQKLIREGEEKIAKGEALIRTGNADIVVQKANYARMVRTMGLASAPKQMEQEIKSLRGIAEKWDNGLDDIKRGEKLIEEGDKNLAEGRAKVRKGDGFVVQGQDQKKAVEIKVQPTDAVTSVEIEDVEPEALY